MAETVNLHHERNTDVLFADVCEARPDIRIDVLDVGDPLGFPGQIQARVQRVGDETLLLGFIIQNYSAFRRRLLWRYRIISIRSAILLLARTLRAGFRIDQAVHAPASAW